MLAALVFVVPLIGQPSQHPEPPPSIGNSTAHQNSPSSEFKEYPYNLQKGTEGSPLIVGVKPQPTSDIEAAARKKKEDDDAFTKGWGIIIGLLGIFLAACQTFIFKRQLEVLSRQTKIQEAMMDQSVEMEGWKCTEHPNRSGLNISFQLVNPTGYFLTLKHGELTFGVAKNTRIIFVYRPFPLPPKKPLTITTFVALNEVKMNTFRTDNFGISVEGSIGFMNALKENINQYFSGIISCQGEETVFESAVELRPSEDGTT